MSLNVIPRAFGTCLVDISNACSDFFAKRMNKVENQKVDDSAHLAHASSTLDKSRTIPVDGKWHCVKSESKNITNAEIQRYIREDKGSLYLFIKKKSNQIKCDRWLVKKKARRHARACAGRVCCNLEKAVVCISECGVAVDRSTMSWKYFLKNDSSDEEEREEEREADRKVRKVEEVRSPSFVVFFLRTHCFEAATAKRNRE